MARVVRFGKTIVNLALVRDVADLDELGLTVPDVDRLHEYLARSRLPRVIRGGDEGTSTGSSRRGTRTIRLEGKARERFMALIQPFVRDWVPGDPLPPPVVWPEDDVEPLDLLSDG